MIMFRSFPSFQQAKKAFAFVAIKFKEHLLFWSNEKLRIV